MGPHDWGHGVLHNSYSPLFMSMGVAIFLFGMAEAWSYGTYNPEYSNDSSWITCNWILTVHLVETGLVP